MLSPERARLGLALGSLCASSSVELSFPLFSGKLVDLFAQGALLDIVTEHTLTCGCVLAFGGVCTFFRLFLIETAIERTSFRMRRELFDALLQRDISFFDQNRTGELVNRLSNDITVTSRVIIDISAGIRSSINSVVGTAMVFTLAPVEMMANLLGPIAVLFVSGVTYGRFVRGLGREKQEVLAQAVQFAEERLSGIRTVRTFNAEARELRGFEHQLDRVYITGRKYAVARGAMSALIVAGGGIFLLHLLHNCGLLVSQGLVSVGTTSSIAMYSFMAGGAYTGLMTAYGDVQKSLGACQKVVEILHGRAPPLPAPHAFAPPSVPGSAAGAPPLAVRLEDVSFYYPTRPDAPVLRGLDLDIPAGARVALLGGSGSGKSTVALLLTGLYQPTGGRILADGHDVFGVPGCAAWARSQLGVVSQEPTLFALSLKDNIAYGIPGGELADPGDDAGKASGAIIDTSAAVSRASRSAHVDEFAERMPEGFDTAVGERGLALSGGQRQRVCIARALARNPRMLIFDEATSALDLRSEALVNAALSEALATGTRTCLVITHRLSALQWVDRVAVIHEGAIVQYGERDEVMSNPCQALADLTRAAATDKVSH